MVTCSFFRKSADFLAGGYIQDAHALLGAHEKEFPVGRKRDGIIPDAIVTFLVCAILKHQPAAGQFPELDDLAIVQADRDHRAIGRNRNIRAMSVRPGLWKSR